MTLIQPILILFIALGLVLYQSRGRSKLLDRGIVFGLAMVGIVLIADPNLSMRIANSLGVVRGVDLVIYVSLIGLAFLCLMVFSKIRAMENQITTVVQAFAVQQAVDAASVTTGTETENVLRQTDNTAG